jgi:hypothetical protein
MYQPAQNISFHTAVYEAILLAVFLIFLGPWTSVAGTHWFIHPKNQHQQKSIKIPSSTAPTNVQRDVSGFLKGFSIGYSQFFRFQQEGRKIAP